MVGGAGPAVRQRLFSGCSLAQEFRLPSCSGAAVPGGDCPGVHGAEPQRIALGVETELPNLGRL